MLNKAGILTEPMEWLWKNKTVNLHSQLQKSRVNVALHISINCEGHHIKLKDLNKLSEITQMISRCSQFSQKDYTKSVHQALKKKKFRKIANTVYCLPSYFRSFKNFFKQFFMLKVEVTTREILEEIYFPLLSILVKTFIFPQNTHLICKAPLFSALC